jgi:F-type H+-transporting ATPase subunit epsilon
MGVLPHRAPILAKLGAGELRVESPEGNADFFINGGFAQMVDDKLTLLTEEAKPKAELDRSKAAQELAAALALPALDEPQAQARERAVTRARALVRVAS